MSEMGLDAKHGGRIRFDTEERHGKKPRAFCVPVQVPAEVYLVLRPRVATATIVHSGTNLDTRCTLLRHRVIFRLKHGGWVTTR